MESRKKFGHVLLTRKKVALSQSHLDKANILENNPTLFAQELATEDKLKEEVIYLVNTCSFLNAILPPIRNVRDTPVTDKKIETIGETYQS